MRGWQRGAGSWGWLVASPAASSLCPGATSRASAGSQSSWELSRQHSRAPASRGAPLWCLPLCHCGQDTGHCSPVRRGTDRVCLESRQREGTELSCQGGSEEEGSVQGKGVPPPAGTRESGRCVTVRETVWHPHSPQGPVFRTHEDPSQVSKRETGTRKET